MTAPTPDLPAGQDADSEAARPRSSGASQPICRRVLDDYERRMTLRLQLLALGRELKWMTAAN